MSAYVLTILSASLAAAVVELLAPKGEGGRIAGHVRMIAGLFLIVALLRPLGEGLRFLASAAEGDLTARLEEALPEGESEDYEEVFGSTLSAVSRAEVEAFVISALDSVFGIPPEDCAVEAVCDTEDSAVSLREVRISLCGGSALENPHPIESYITAQLQCPCYVTVQI